MMEQYPHTVKTPIKGELYHVTWLRKEYTWKCLFVDEQSKTVTLTTKDHKKKIENVKWTDLRHTNRNKQLNSH